MGKEVSMVSEDAKNEATEPVANESVNAGEGSEAKAYELPVKSGIDQHRELVMEMEAIKRELEEEGHTNHFYDDDSVVTIPGKLFAAISNHLVLSSNNYMQMQANHMLMAESEVAMLVETTGYNLELMKIHAANARAGITSPAPTAPAEESDTKVDESTESAADEFEATEKE